MQSLYAVVHLGEKREKNEAYNEDRKRPQKPVFVCYFVGLLVKEAGFRFIRRKCKGGNPEFYAAKNKSVYLRFLIYTF